MLIFFFLTLIVHSEFQKDRSYTVSVMSKYYNVQPIEHFLYFLSDFPISTSNNFLTAIIQHPDKSKSINDIEFLFSTLSKLSLISKTSLSYLRTYIDLNYFLPRCEMYRSIAHDITTDSIDLISNDSGFFVASQHPIENVENFQSFQTNFTQTFKFDLHLNENDSQRETLFIYADLTKPKACDYIISILNQPNSDYNIILRPISFTKTASNLRGFGVELRPYKYMMEYEVDEPVEESNRPSQNKVNREDVTVKDVNFDVSSDYVNYSDISHLGSRFISFLTSEKRRIDEETSDNRERKEIPELLRDMSNNWPLYIRRISEEEVSVDSTKEFEKISVFTEGSSDPNQNQNKDDDNGNIYSISSLNGRAVSTHNFDPFSFLDSLHEEQRVSDVLLNEFNLTRDDISFTETLHSNNDFLLDFRTKFAIWDKDFENDPEYDDYSTNIKDIFRLKKNILNFAVYMDPSSPRHITELYTVYLLSQPGKLQGTQGKPTLPMRIGIIPHFNLGSRISRHISFAFAHIALHNPNDAIMFLIHSLAFWQKSQRNKKEQRQITEEHYMDAYDLIKGSYKINWNDIHVLYGKSSREYKFIKDANKYFKSTGAKLGSIRINGKEVALDQSFQDLVVQIKQMLVSINKICMKEKITDVAGIDLVDILKKEYLVVESIDSKTIKSPVIGTGVLKMKIRQQKKFIDAFNQVEWKHKDNSMPRSYFVLFTSENVAEKEIEQKEESDKDEDEDQDEDSIQKVEKSGDIDLFIDFAMNRNHKRSTAFAINPPALRELIEIAPNETALLVNGRLYRSFKIESIDQLKLIDMWTNHFVLSYIDKAADRNNRHQPPPPKREEADFESFDEFENENENENYRSISNDEDDSASSSNANDDVDDHAPRKPISFEALTYLSALVVDWRSFSVKRIDLQSIIDGVSGIKESPLYYRSNKDGQKSDKIEWTLVVDPFSRNFQKISDFVYHMSTVRNCVDLQLVLVPPQKIENNQQASNLNSFYRFSLSSDDVTFSMLNDSTSYSTFIDTPQSWLLETLKTSENVDIDSIHLSRPNSDSEATFLLSSMVVEGKCFINGAPNPKYAEIGLFTKKCPRNNFKSEKVDETMVMAMNNYFQFKADPGIYRVVFSTNTSSSLYTFDTVENSIQNYPLFDNIYIHTFSMKETILNAKTRAKNVDGFKRNLLERLNRLKIESASSNKTKSHINIFTISSGKLYEKLCKIMFLSVREHTNSQITFYLIKSFLSPSFKASLPEMSKKYFFNYYLVDYKWPSFLFKQKEKQRYIWANKILFLDVLFPSNVDKIIYVDADQIVRTDLQELMNLNITENGAPYAFVPFCDSRPELEPYRFWKQGYWKNALSKEKSGQISNENKFEVPSSYNYHISALFLIDMLKFKELSAGDLIRIQYQQLAPDPNNLANLDQDLPNMMQKHIPIYSLSQDWLWCETWCADEEMESAKTIDLCNNPLTKVNKIEIAKKKIEEWPKLEDEAKKTEANFSSSDYEQIVFHN